MNTRLCRRCAAVASLTLLLAACGSTPTRYYTLVASSATAGNTAQNGGARTPYAIELLPVSVPAQVDTRPLVLRAGTGRLSIEDAHEWAAPLPDEIHQALSNDLTQALGAEDVYGLPHDGTTPVYRIDVAVTRFDSTYGRDALIEARWAVHAVHGKAAALTCSSRQQQTIAPGYDALVQGHQRALAGLAGDIAAGVRALSAGQARCPGPG